MLRIVCILLYSCVTVTASAGLSDVASKEIEHLLAYVAEADVVFVRNGKDHTAANAVEHMKKKRDHFRDKISSAEDFIAYAATKSLLSGKPYTVRQADGTTEPCADWLTRELKRFREDGEESTQRGD